MGEFRKVEEFYRAAAASDSVHAALRGYALVRRGHALWYLGFPDQALALAKEGSRLGADDNDRYTHVGALSWAGQVHMSCGQLAEAEDLFQQSLNICTERGFLASRATITIFMGLVSVLRGQPQAGLEQVRRGMAFFAASSATKLEGYHLALALASAGKPDEALAALIPRLEKMEQRGMQNDLADMHHFKGRLLEGKSNSEEAEKSFRTSIEIARRQSAKSLELRATISLTRLLAKQGRRDEARATLAEIYNWFTEGFDTADLKDAKAQLEELSDRQTTTTRR